MQMYKWKDNTFTLIDEENNVAVLEETAGNVLRLLRDDIVYKEYDVRYIDHVQWSITGKCNAKCRHCFIDAKDNNVKDLSFDEIVDIIEKLAKNHVRIVALTGGEPLLRADNDRIIETFYKNNIKVTTVSTNGFLLTDNILDIFEKYNMKPCFVISFDGLSHHDFLRGIDGAEKMTIAAIRRCVKRDYKVILSMCLHGDNIDSIDDTVKFAANEGCETIMLSPISDYNNEVINRGVKVLSLDEIFDIYVDYLKTFLKQNINITVDFRGLIKIDGKNHKNYLLTPLKSVCYSEDIDCICEEAKHSIYISQTGQVLPCFYFVGTELQNTFPYIKDKSLSECLNDKAFVDFMNITVKDILAHNEKCNKCKYLKHCGGGCRAVALSEKNGIYGMNESRCVIYEGKWIHEVQNIISKV